MNGVHVVRAQVAISPVSATRRIEWPSVGVVVVTRDRPNLLRRAIDSIAAQDYPGPMRLVVVYDGTRPDWRVAAGGARPVLVLENWRTPGTAGARNTGVLAVGDCELIAFCDDWDTWSSSKLTTQVAAMCSRPGTVFCTCAAEVEFDGHRAPWLSGLDEVTPVALTRDRAAALPVSGIVAAQRAIASGQRRGGIGLIDESAPAHDWDLLVRAAAQAPILHLDAPLVRRLWRAPSTDRRACDTQVATLRWMLEHHPELGAQLVADLACWCAAAGDRRASRRWAVAALRGGRLDRRALRAVAAATGLLGRRRLARRLSGRP